MAGRLILEDLLSQTTLSYLGISINLKVYNLEDMDLLFKKFCNQNA